MAQYRCYLLDGSGRIVKSEDIDAITDDDAIVLARERLAEHNSHAFELWQGRDRLHKETRTIAGK